MIEQGFPVLPGLRLIREVGRGGTGVVYAAERRDDGSAVAVKVLRPEFAAPRWRRRLRDEARRIAAVDHPGIVRVLDIGERQDLTWLVLELVDGPSLQDVLDRQGPPAPSIAAELVAQAADAVAAMHAAGLAHGDLKPANILLRQWPGAEMTIDLSTPVKVTDFGLTRRLPEAREVGLSLGTDWLHTDATAIDRAAGGTVAYMAPEQWRGDPVTARGDVYGLGGTLYAALTGERPFARPSLPELAYAVATSPAPTPSSRARDIPVDLDVVVARALAKDPDDRYADAGRLASAIRAAAHRGPTAPADSPVPTTSPAAIAGEPAGMPGTQPPRRRRWRGRIARILSPAALVLALCMFGSGFLTVSCAPGGYGRAAPGTSTTYTGSDLATGGVPHVDKLRPDKDRRPDKLAAQPLIALAALLLAAGAVSSVVLRRRRQVVVAALATAAAVCLAIGEAVAKAALTDMFVAQLTAPLPPNRHVSDYIRVGNAFWASITATLAVAAAHAVAAVRFRHRLPAPPDRAMPPSVADRVR